MSQIEVSSVTLIPKFVNCLRARSPPVSQHNPSVPSVDRPPPPPSGGGDNPSVPSMDSPPPSGGGDNPSVSSMDRTPMAYMSMGSSSYPSAFLSRPLALLDLRSHLSNSRNETTAEFSIDGCTVAVTFWMADPPELTYFSVHTNKPHPSFRVFPHVVGTEGPFVLFHARFYGCPQDDYFMYKADSGWPSLELLPRPPHGRKDKVSEFGIVPCCSSCHYRLAALLSPSSGYQLEIYISETKTWSTMTLVNPLPGLKIVPDKVVSLGEGSLGWVDFSSGLLACDLRQATPCLSFIPLPTPMPENRATLLKTESEEGQFITARWFRDLTCVNGTLKFIKIENRFIESDEKLPIDPYDNAILLDSDLIMSFKHQVMDDKDKTRAACRAIIWTRAVSSGCWFKRCALDFNDIMFKSGQHDWGGNYFSFPTLSPYGDDLLYFKLMEKTTARNGWVFAVDLGDKTIKALSFEDATFFLQAFRLCTLSDHLIITPGTKRSAYVKITKGKSSANGPDDKPVDGPIFCESKGKPQPVRALAKANCAVNEAKNDDLSWDKAPFGNNNVESTRKL